MGESFGSFEAPQQHQETEVDDFLNDAELTQGSPDELTEASNDLANADLTDDADEAESGTPVAEDLQVSEQQESAPTPNEAAFVEVKEPIAKLRFADPETAQYLELHHVRFNPVTNELFFDLDNDGTISDKEVTWNLNDHLSQYDHSELHVDEDGNLVIDSFDGESGQKETIAFTPTGDRI